MIVSEFKTLVVYTVSGIRAMFIWAAQVKLGLIYNYNIQWNYMYKY